MPITMPNDRKTKVWTNAEMTALFKLKEKLEDLDLSNPLLEDRRLINWLRARDLKIDAAETMLRKHLEFRQENKLDTLLTSDIVPVDHPLLAALPVEVFGHAKDGNSILVLVAGEMDIKQIVQTFDKDMCMNIIYYLLETAYADIVNQSTDPNVLKKAYYIADIGGIRFKDYLSADVLDLMISALKVVEANYPELLHKAIIINAPFLYPVLWNLLKPFLSTNTLNKVEIFGTNQEKYLKILKDSIGSDQLPRKYGGTGYSQRIPVLNISETSSSSSQSKLSFADLDLSKTVISAGDSFELCFDVDVPKAVLSWSFKTKNYDIGFSVLYKPFLVNNRSYDYTREKIPYKRLNSQKSVESGSLVCDVPGHYILRFDNTYSRLREKMLQYHVAMTQITTNGNEHAAILARN